MTDSGTWLAVATGVLLIALSAIIGYYLLQRLRAQRQRILADLSSSPVFADDRAFNQIRMARSELEVLRRDGGDVPRAEELLRAADSALSRRQNVEAVRLAQDAHRLLVEARRAQQPPLVGAPPGPSKGSSPAADPFSGGPTVRPAVDLLASPSSGEPRGGFGPAANSEAEAGPAGVGDRPPKNRMEAHFQMTLLVGEIVSAQGAPGRAEAEGLRGQAQSAYARADYTEALRLALRGRRALGSRLETLPAVGSAGGSRAPGALAPTPDRAAAASRSCAQCGRPLQAEDRFCRGCGATNVPTQCPRCQGELGPSDTFCGRCGAPVS